MAVSLLLVDHLQAMIMSLQTQLASRSCSRFVVKRSPTADIAEPKAMRAHMDARHQRPSRPIRYNPTRPGASATRALTCSAPFATFTVPRSQPRAGQFLMMG